MIVVVKQKTAYEMRISDWSSDVCSSDLCLLEANDGTCLFDRKVPDPIAAAGVNFEATLGRDIPLGGHHGIRVRGLLYGDIYPDQHDYSQATAIGRVGYRYQSARDTVALSPSFEVGSRGSSILYDQHGIYAAWNNILSTARTIR